jgi:hypothetical protein
MGMNKIIRPGQTHVPVIVCEPEGTPERALACGESEETVNVLFYASSMPHERRVSKRYVTRTHWIEESAVPR